MLTSRVDFQELRNRLLRRRLGLAPRHFVERPYNIPGVATVRKQVALRNLLASVLVVPQIALTVGCLAPVILLQKR
jgi:hypothetical protein